MLKYGLNTTTIADAIKEHPEAATVEVYDFAGDSRSIHTDNITLVEDYNEGDKVDRYALMDGEDYGSTVLANSGLTWQEIESSFPVLVIIRVKKDGKMAYEYIKDSGEGEVYSNGSKHFLFSWGWSIWRSGGVHNRYDKDILVCEWTGDPCSPQDLPPFSDPGWKEYSGFDVDGEDEVDWDDYADKVKSILAAE